MIHMAKEKGAEIIELTTSRIPSRFTIADGLGNWPLLDKEYESIKRNGMGKKEEKITNNFIKHCINAPLTQDCVVKYKESFFNSIKRYLHYLKIIIKYKKLPDFTITVAPMVIWPIKQKLFQILNHFEEPINGEKYIFFPLHFQPEASTLIYGKWYLDQVALIENISKAIPLGYKLYVKEHSYGFGSRPFNYYKRLKKLPNVRLISPYTNTTDLIKKSSLVVTITGTVGWEACLLGKRVLTLGDIFYNTFDEVVKVKEIEELSNLIFKNLDKEINEKQLIYFVAAVFRSTFPGLTRLPSDCKDICLESKNISNLTDGIKNYIHQMKMLE